VGFCVTTQWKESACVITRWSHNTVVRRVLLRGVRCSSGSPTYHEGRTRLSYWCCTTFYGRKGSFSNIVYQRNLYRTGRAWLWAAVFRSLISRCVINYPSWAPAAVRRRCRSWWHLCVCLCRNWKTPHEKLT